MNGLFRMNSGVGNDCGGISVPVIVRAIPFRFPDPIPERADRVFQFFSGEIAGKGIHKRNI